MSKRQVVFVVSCVIGMSLFLTGCSTPPPPEPTPLPSETAVPSTPTPLPTATITATPVPAEIEITFIDNAGFLITAGEKKIIIDALYEGLPYGSKPPSRTVHQIIAGDPPFDSIDLVLITHRHFDHFSADLLTEFLHNHPETVLVSTQGVVERLISKDSDFATRLHPLSLAPGEMQPISVTEFDLEAYYISHGDPDFPNLGFLITLPGGRILHTGDMVTEAVSVDDLIAYGLPDKQIDVALIPLYIFQDEAYHAHITSGIEARYSIPMHFSYRAAPQPEEILANFPEAIVFQNSMESWVVP